jgi:hypothetical protein
MPQVRDEIESVLVKAEDLVRRLHEAMTTRVITTETCSVAQDVGAEVNELWKKSRG